MPNNDNYEYMKFLDITGTQTLWNTCKQTFVQTVNGVGIDANGNCQVATGTPLDAYPIGAIYLTTNNSTSPASLFGGTWERIKDRFLLGAGDTYTAGDTGGEATHTLTINEMPKHRHEIKVIGSNTEWQGRINANVEGGVWTTRSDMMNDTGGNQAHNNMPPYLVVYMWKRIS